jgi:hypothetical protein
MKRVMGWASERVRRKEETEVGEEILTLSTLYSFSRLFDLCCMLLYLQLLRILIRTHLRF